MPSLRKLVFFLVVLLLPTVSALAGPTTPAGPYRLEVHTAPSVVALGKGQILVTVTDAAGKPLDGLTVTALTGMPGMSMGEREESGRPKDGQPGTYQVAAQYPMAGSYTSTIQIKGALGNATTRIGLTTGEDTAATGKEGFPLGKALGLVLVFATVAFVLYRVRKTGQTIDVRALFHRQVLGGLALLAALTAAAVYVVGHGRRDGAMTPLDAQAADMTNMPPPSGTTPVELASVTRGSITRTLRTAGTAVGYTEQDIAARAPGVLQSVLVYPGDKVAKGQLLARLDTRQSAPQTAEKAAAATMARQGVSVAQAEKAQAEQQIDQAQAELAGKKGALDEARALVLSATEEAASTEAAHTAAEAQTAGAQAELQAAQADHLYWQQQLQRSEKLHGAGAISGEELQRDSAQAAGVAAKVQQATAKHGEASALVKAAQSARKKAEAQVVAARAKVAMAVAELAAHRVHVRAASAAVTTAARKVDQAQSGATQAGAALQSATINQGFSEMHAESEGVVVSRIVSPGTLVSPGQAVLKVAQIRPLRLQATVAEADLAQIHVGSLARIQLRNGGTALTAHITSVSPQVDPVARTGTVEALVPNAAGKLLPGQYVAFEIETGASRSSLRVPTPAIQYGTQSQPFVWLAEPAGPGQRSAKRVPVTLGVVGRDMVEIRSGLREGQRVVVKGATYLKNGDAVSQAERPDEPGPGLDTSGAVVARITVTEQGYEPASIPVKVNVPVKLTFIRTTDKTCGTEVLFPDYGINQKLPLNTPTVVTFTPKKAGEIFFACGMNMLRGKVVAQ